MIARPGHPSTHGHHVNPYTCRKGNHAICDGFSGDYDTYTCGCCCRDLPTTRGSVFKVD